MPPHLGGITPIAIGLYHRWPSVRESTMELLDTIKQFVPGQLSIGSLNYFHRKTYVQLLEQREVALGRREHYDEGTRAGMEYMSPESVLGSQASTPQGYTRG
jgi:hypothetical protein